METVMPLRWFAGVHYDFLPSKAHQGTLCITISIVRVDLGFFPCLTERGKEENQYVECKSLKLHIYLQTSFRRIII